MSGPDSRDVGSALTGLSFVDPQQHLACVQVEASRPQPWPSTSSTETAGAVAGLRVAALGRMLTLDELTEMTDGTSLLAVHAGALVHEWYRPGLSPGSAFLGASMTKSVLSVLVGRAVAAGHLDVDDAVADLVPDVAGSGYATVTVRHLLTMTSGVAWAEDYRDPSSPASRLLGCFLGGTGDASRGLLVGAVRHARPGSRYAYCTADSQLLDWVREVATGDTFVVAVQRLWDELGAEYPAYVLTDRDGVAFAGGGLAAASRDWARVGELMLTGRCGDARLTSSWREHACVPSYEHTRVGRLPETLTSHAGFGYHWWPLRDDGRRVTADGSRGQFTYLDRDLQAVVVKTSQWRYDDPFTDRAYRDACYLVLPEVAATVAAADAAQGAGRPETR